jgi:hypothetical protein
MILAMTPQSTAAKLLLIEDRRVPTREPGPLPVRRFRLARLQADGRARAPEARFEHIRRAFD